MLVDQVAGSGSVRTAIIIGIGLALLAVFAIGARIGGVGLRGVLPWFAVLWAAAAAANMYVGIARAGYSFQEELPVFLVIAGVPIAVGWAVVWWLSSKSGS
jgi:hypothetical protein